MNAVPRGDIIHLYACATTTSNRVLANGSQPTACVAVDDGERSFLRSGGCNGLEFGDLPRRHLDGTEGDDIDVLPDLGNELGGRNQPNRDPAVFLHEEREEERSELDVGRAHSCTVGNRGRHEADERRDVRSDCDSLERDADEPGERGASLLSGDAPVLPARASGAPVLEGRLERIPGGSWRQSVRRGVQVRTRRRPQRLNSGGNGDLLHTGQSDSYVIRVCFGCARRGEARARKLKEDVCESD